MRKFIQYKGNKVLFIKIILNKRLKLLNPQKEQLFLHIAAREVINLMAYSLQKQALTKFIRRQ